MENNKGIQSNYFGSLFHVQMMQKLALLLQKLPKRSKSRTKYDKIGLNAILFVGLKQVWNSTEDIKANQFRPYARPRMSKIWLKVGQKMPQIGKKYPVGP